MKHLHFFHGFFGLPVDWTPVLLHLKPLFIQAQPQYHLHDLWKDLESLPDPSMKNWGLRLTQKLPPSGNILIGYSMGGRLLMHFPAWEQRKIDGLFLIGAHPGLTSPLEKSERLQSDKKWADKFLKEPWNAVTSDWGRQPIFAYDKMRPPRKETDFSRATLAKALDHWSLGKQDDMAERLKEFQFPIYYIYGDRDEKYAGIGKALKERVPSIHLKELRGGHSCQFSNPSDIAGQIKSFLSRPAQLT